MEQGAVSTGLSRSHGGRLRSTVTALAAVLAVVGCTPSAAELTPPPPTTPPASATPTPTPPAEAIAPPEQPAEMERSDEVGAKAAAEYFINLFVFTMASGDTAEWDRISEFGCGFCEAVSNEARAISDSGGNYSGGGVSISEVRIVGFDEVVRVHAVEVAYTSGEALVLDAEGSLLETREAGSGYLLLDVGSTPNGWRLLNGGAHDEPLA